MWMQSTLIYSGVQNIFSFTIITFRCVGDGLLCSSYAPATCSVGSPPLGPTHGHRQWKLGVFQGWGSLLKEGPFGTHTTIPGQGAAFWECRCSLWAEAWRELQKHSASFGWRQAWHLVGCSLCSGSLWRLRVCVLETCMMLEKAFPPHSVRHEIIFAFRGFQEATTTTLLQWQFWGELPAQ